MGFKKTSSGVLNFQNPTVDVWTENIFMSVNHPFAQEPYREQYFRTCALGATVGGGVLNSVFLKYLFMNIPHEDQTVHTSRGHIDFFSYQCWTCSVFRGENVWSVGGQERCQNKP